MKVWVQASNIDGPHSIFSLTKNPKHYTYSNVQKYFLIIIHGTRAIISRGFYIAHPIFKDHFFVFKEVFSDNSVLVFMACIQERLVIKSGLWWRAYGISYYHSFLFLRRFFSENSVIIYGLYSRAACNQERLMIAHVRYLLTNFFFSTGPIQILLVNYMKGKIHLEAFATVLTSL